MGTPIKAVMDEVMAQEGDDYIFGVEDSPDNPNPKAFDCSELVEWGCARAKVVPTMPDGAMYQVRHCHKHGTLIPVEQARKTFGALLFAFSSSPFIGGRPDHSHVGFSLGDGRTFEARGKDYGVGIFERRGGWTHAARIPGVEYEEE